MKRRFSGGDELLKGFLHVHESCMKYGATPRRYIAFLYAYKNVYSKKKCGIETRQRHLQVNGVFIMNLVCGSLRIILSYNKSRS